MHINSHQVCRGAFGDGQLGTEKSPSCSASNHTHRLAFPALPTHTNQQIVDSALTLTLSMGKFTTILNFTLPLNIQGS